MKNQRDIVFGAVFGAVLGVVGLKVAPGVAQSLDPATDTLARVIAYDGTLAYEGAPIDGAVDLRFTLFARDDFALWSEEKLDVAVSGGRFAVLLGETTPLTDVVLQSGTALIGIELRVEGSDEWITLAGRQLIGATPRSMWGAAAPDLSVAGSLTVGGAVSFTGSLGSDYVLVRGDMVLQKTSAQLSLGSTGGPHGVAFADAGGQGAQLVFRTTGNQLVLEDNNDASDTTDELTAGTDGTLKTTGAADIDGAVTVNGGDFTVSPGASGTGLTLTGGDILLGRGHSNWKGVLFMDNETNDSTEGIQFHYRTASNGLALEAKANFVDNGDLWYIDDGGDMYVNGDLEVGGMVVDDKSFSANTDIEAGDGDDNTGDKDFYADSSCTTGAIALGINDDGQANICVCMDGERTQGWYCWN